MAAKKHPAIPFSAHPGVAMVARTIEQLKAKTGRTLAEWLALLEHAGPTGAAARRAWLKKEHGLGTNYAGWLASWSEGDRRIDADPRAYLVAARGYVDRLFSGGKAGLRPIYERLAILGLGLGKDVRVCPCTTMIPLYRRHVFATITPATRTRVDFGLALGPLIGQRKLPARLIDTGGFAKKDRITHRIALATVDECDADVARWAAQAYALDA